MNYNEFLFYPLKFEELYNKSKSSFKKQYLEMYTDCINELKQQPDIWRWDATHRHFKNIKAHKQRKLIDEVELQSKALRILISGREGELITHDVSSFLEEFITPDECAVHCIKICIDELTSNENSSERLVEAAKLQQQIKASDMLQEVLDWAENTVFSRSQGANKGNKSKKDKIDIDPALNFAKGIALEIWKQKPELNISAVTKLSLYALQLPLNNFIKHNCVQFVHLGLYLEHNKADFENVETYMGAEDKSSSYYQSNFCYHPDDEYIVCTPVELPKFDKLRTHIEKIAPKTATKRVRDYRPLEDQVYELIACHNENCACLK
jgi:hypothetical protein